MLLKNKTVVLTGANRGIGKSILETFSLNGADIFACARSIDENFLTLIDRLKKSYKTNIIPIQIDLLKEEQQPNLVEQPKPNLDGDPNLNTK